MNTFTESISLATFLVYIIIILVTIKDGRGRVSVISLHELNITIIK